MRFKFRKRLRDTLALWFSKSFCQVFHGGGRNFGIWHQTERWVKPCNLTSSVVQLLVVFQNL